MVWCFFGFGLFRFGFVLVILLSILVGFGVSYSRLRGWVVWGVTLVGCVFGICLFRVVWGLVILVVWLGFSVKWIAIATCGGLA